VHASMQSMMGINGCVFLAVFRLLCKMASSMKDLIVSFCYISSSTGKAA
jgi:hypothetical protein